MIRLGCRCTKDRRDGWTHVGEQIWVHPGCGQPARWKVEEDMANIETQYFYGGPHHNLVVSAHDLLHERRSGLTEYRWTHNLITGSASGRRARVWAHESADDAALESFLASVSQ